jgi:hypothetical protein
MYFNAEVQIRDFLTTVSLDAKIRFNYLIELGNTTSDWTTGDDVYTRAKGVEVLCSMNVCVWDHTWVSVCMSSKHHKSTFILFLSHSRMPCSILSRVGWVRQWRKTWTACNLVADGMSKSHSSDVPHETERYKNLQLENTDVVEIQLPDEI